MNDNTLFQYVKTERAHFMCPNMHFAILFELPKRYDEDRIQKTCDVLSRAHPFLRALMAYEGKTENLYYNVTDNSQIQIIYRDEPFSIKDYEEIDESEWNIFEKGLLKVFGYNNGATTTILFVVYHLLADGKGALELAQEFANYYVGSDLPLEAEEHLISNISELPEGSELKGISKWLIRRTNRKWLREGKKLDYKTYLMLVKEYAETHSVKHIVQSIDANEYTAIRNLCEINDVTVNDVLLAKMFLEDGCNKIIMAVDIRDSLKNHKKGSLGNYASAFSIESKSVATEVGEKAREVHNLVKKKIMNTHDLFLILACYFAIEPTLLDGAAMAGVGLFNSKAAAFVGRTILGYDQPSAFSITNLGKLNNNNMIYAAFIPPASPATKKTVGVVTVNNQMMVCSSINTDHLSKMV